MHYQTIVKSVFALPVKEIIELAQTDFKRLPVWFKKHYQAGNVAIGSNKLICENDHWRFEAGLDDYLIRNDKDQLESMKAVAFHEMFEDPFTKK